MELKITVYFIALQLKLDNGHDRKHIDFFRGDRFLKWWTSPANVARIPFSGIDKKDAKYFAQLLIDNHFIHSIERDGVKQRVFNATNLKNFDEERMYSWDIDTEDTWGNILLLVFVGCVIGICLLPVWPSFLKLTLYYILLAYMIIFLGVLGVRYLLWFICWPFGYSVWIFPRLNDDVGLKESFQPFITCKRSKTATLKRLIIFGSVIGAFYYVFFHYDVPEFVRENKQFMEDIYKGRLLDMFSANSFYDKADGVKQTKGGKDQQQEEEEHKSTTWSESKRTDVDDIPKDDHPEDWDDEPEEEDQEAALNRMGARIINPETYSEEQYKADMEYYSKKDEEMEKQYEREEKERQRKEKIKEQKEKERKEREAQIRWEKREKERLERLEREKKEQENAQDLDEEEL